MLHWLQNALPKRYVLLLQIFCLSLFLHFFLAFCLTLIGYFTNKPLVFTVHTKNISNQPIYYMPLIRTAIPRQASGLRQRLRRTRRDERGEGRAQPLRNSIPKKIEPIQKKTFVKKVQKKPENLKSAATPQVSKILTKKVEPITALKKEPEKKKTDKEIEGSKLSSDKHLSDSKLAQQKQVFGREDLSALRLYESIQSEVTQYWAPPVGLSKDLECKLKVSIDNQGKVAKISMEKMSGVLIYDLSAKMALQKVGMPKEVFGKEIILTFKQ